MIFAQGDTLTERAYPDWPRPARIIDLFYPTSTLADLYDPLTMPAPLLKAHQQLDRTVDRCYRPEPFPSDRHRVEYLFALYEKLTAPLVAAAKPARKGRKVQAIA